MNKKGQVKNIKKTNNTKAKNKEETIKDFKGTWLKLINYSFKYKVLFIVSSIFSLIGAMVNIFAPRLSGSVLNILSKGSSEGLPGEGINFEAITEKLITLFFMYSLLATVSCISNYLNSLISVDITYRMRDDLSKKINRLPIGYFNKETYGETISRITNDVDILVSSMTNTLSSALSSITILIGVILMMFSISWEMTFISFLDIPLSLIFSSLVLKVSRRYFKRYQKQLGLINGHIEEMYSGHNAVRAYNGERDSIEKFKKLNTQMYNLSWKSEFASGFVSPIMEFVSSFIYISLCVFGGYLATVKGLSIGNIFAFFMYANQFKQPFFSVSRLSFTFQQIAVAAERVFEFMDLEENTSDGENCIKVSNEDNTVGVKIKGNVRFNNVVFGYNSKNIVIKDFSLDVKEGQTIAIVGPVGAGKTTIIKLLNRIYDVNEGSISIDGYNIKDFKRKDLQSLFGVVFQEPWLFRGTILENIKYGKVDSSDEEVKNAAKLACADGFIKRLPYEYDTIINESAKNISQGEKQLLTIARAILADHRILILDEATSSVDTNTEIRIQKALKSLMKGRTSFIIAHRLSTIRNADLIVVVNKGVIEEKGKHKDLLKNKGLYYKMHVGQFGGLNI